MPYSSEVIGRARQRLENEKTEKRSRYYANLEQAYREVPRLKEIDRLLRQTMVKTSGAVFAEPRFSTDNAMGVAIIAHRIQGE